MFLLFTIYLIVYCKKGVCHYYGTTFFYAQSPDFPKPGYNLKQVLKTNSS